MQLNIANWIDRWAGRRPNAEALVCNGHRLTYRQLSESVNQVAAGLRVLGVRPGDRVACLMPNRIEFLETFWATVRLGAIFVPLNTHLTASELDYVLRDVEPAVCLVDAGFADRAAALAGPTSVGTWLTVGEQRGPDSGMPSGEEPVLAHPTGDDSPAAILYTSGTTGFPKGAILAHGTIYAQAAGWVQAFNTGRADRHLLFLPLCFTGGLVSGAMNPVFSGATVILQPRFDPAAVLAAIEGERITWFTTVPTMLERLFAHPDAARRDLSSLTRVESGGSPVPVPLIDEARERGIVVMQGYGLTECAAGPCLFLDAEDGATKAGSVGLPTLVNEARIVDDNDHDVRPGDVGELLVRGPIVFAGYWRNPEASAAALRGGWLHTGDLARQDEDGYYYIAGRKTEMIISGGLNVYPLEVERVLNAIPGVRESAVVGRPDAVWGEAVTAFVIVEPGRSLAAETLIDAARVHLAGYKTPKRVVLVDELPRTASGKIRKHLLGHRPAGDVT